ncbi:Hsp20/alpha crystallin family protein [Roseibacterium sp. SDUM158017]|uniref:Hsp20/alpha crystallin family protein n=1 Tax=Roseicyclus salinarum TaxID=3036773 RepID=UPI0024156981|nr:Hsp20/alpha crystallin family protein [Roseibacterium sp. SDUM158017]MDG4648422.1 Hsp20/alpha crystallin family protein [Roseibacterium sp. SDUM158017]
MTKSRKSPLGDVGDALDERLGGLLGELGSALGEVFDRLDRLGEGEILRERSFEMPQGAVRAGIRVRVGGLAGASSRQNAPGERPVDRPLRKGAGAGIRPAPGRAAPGPDGRGDERQPAPEAPGREPVRPVEATILAAGGGWTLVADLPGVAEGDVALRDGEDGASLVVEAQGRGRRYRGEFDLPAGLRAADLTVSLVNGILELRGKVGAP